MIILKNEVRTMIMNNTCKAVIEALLNKSKCRTTRKAFRIVKRRDEPNPKEEIINTFHNDGSTYWTLKKPAKYKVGDIVDMCVEF